MTKRLGMLVALAASSLVFAASASAATPIKIMTLGAINAPGFSLPSIPVGAQIAVDAINRSGGVSGHKLQLLVCNDQNNPATATGCARTAIKQKVAAVVGGLSIFDAKIIPYLTQAKIPWVGPTLASPLFNVPNLFLLGGESAPGYGAVGMALVQQGCRKIATILSAQSLPGSDAQIAAGVKAGGHGAKVVSDTKAPANSSDWAPIVAAARDAGADCIASGTGPGESGGLIAAMNTGKRFKKAVFLSGGLPDALLQQLGKGADGIEAIAGYLPSSAHQGVVQALGKQVHARYPKVSYDQFAQAGYAATNLVALAAKGQKNVTGASIMAALNKVKRFDSGLGPVVGYTKPLRIPGFSRIFNPRIFLYVSKNGKFQLAQAKPIDTTPALKLMK